ncbi:DUF1311 domain-containing protein [Pseudomonas sp. PDM18]|uniref:lysozyme inhibitor LprI family protein n=1 Tax=unclassified Pseudomonas TaxID=196821 RepID=UPI00177FF774|nr:lysozyme inhibitor LprI family protein [Pseudomonas sp. PDM18]MBD9678357.1 DUF1311 domain-containing protein [Pseudomonas sp. PDM18]
MKFVGLSALLSVSLGVQAGYFSDDGGIKHAADHVDDCFNLNDNGEVARCVDYFRQQAGSALESEVKRVRDKLKKDTEQFDDAQQKWLAFKDSECALRALRSRAFADPSTARELFTWACSARLDEQRVDELRSLPLLCDACLH